MWPSGETHQLYFCAICGGPGSTKHHLVPKAVRIKRGLLANKIMRCCPKCHADIHYYFSHWELATRFNEEKPLKAELEKRKTV